MEVSYPTSFIVNNIYQSNDGISILGLLTSLVALIMTVYIAYLQNQFEKIRKFKAKGIFNSPKLGITFIQEDTQCEMFSGVSGEFGNHIIVKLRKASFQIRVLESLLSNGECLKVKFSWNTEVFHPGLQPTKDSLNEIALSEGFRSIDSGADYRFHSNEIWLMDAKTNQSFFLDRIVERKENYGYLQFSKFREELDSCELSPSYKSKALPFNNISRPLYLTVWLISANANDIIPKSNIEFFILDFN